MVKRNQEAAVLALGAERAPAAGDVEDEFGIAVDNGLRELVIERRERAQPVRITEAVVRQCAVELADDPEGERKAVGDLERALVGAAAVVVVIPERNGGKVLPLAQVGGELLEEDRAAAVHVDRLRCREDDAVGQLLQGQTQPALVVEGEAPTEGAGGKDGKAGPGRRFVAGLLADQKRAADGGGAAGSDLAAGLEGLQSAEGEFERGRAVQTQPARVREGELAVHLHRASGRGEGGDAGLFRRGDKARSGIDLHVQRSTLYALAGKERGGRGIGLENDAAFLDVQHRSGLVGVVAGQEQGGRSGLGKGRSLHEGEPVLRREVGVAF